MKQFFRKAPQDINALLSSAKESNVKLTFKDLYMDYKHYRRAYFFHKVLESPKESIARHLEKKPVDLTNYSSWGTFKWLMMNEHIFGTEQDIFKKAITFTGLILGFIVLRLPVEKYYRWQDPLYDPDWDMEIQGEATLRRLKYKRKVSNWQEPL